MTVSAKEVGSTSAKGEGTGGDEKGELVTESSAEIMEMLRGRFRIAAQLFIGSGILLLVIGLVLAFVLEVPWWLYIAFFAGAAFLFFFGAMFVSVYLGVPRLQVYQGGVMLKPPRGRTVFHPWSGFSNYKLKTMAEMKVIELQPKGDGEPISIHQHVPRFDDVLKLVEDNLEQME